MSKIPKYLENLNENQLKSVLHTEGPLRIIAVAGSGKTTVLVNKVAYLVDNGVIPEKILLLTFTNKAAQNMIDRAAKLKNENCKNVCACTYHSLCLKLVKQYSEKLKLPDNFVIETPVEEAERVEYVKAKLGDYNEMSDFPSGQELINAWSYALNTETPIEDVLEQKHWIEFKQDIFKIKEAYEKHKKEVNVLSFDDLLIYTDRLLDIPEVRQKIQQSFDYIMVDEYQDTNNLQEHILVRLVNNQHNITIVGDDYQSIYKFRGADVSKIINFNNLYKECESITIDINYRSSDEVLDFVNAMMDYKATFGIHKTMAGINRHSEKPKLIKVQTEVDEAYYIFKNIIDAVNENKNLDDYAILSRASKSSALLETLLTKSEIPYEKLGGKKFLELDCIKDMIAFMKCISNPFDTVSWFRVLKIMPQIGDARSQVISEKCTDRNFLLREEFNELKCSDSLIILNNAFKNFRKKTDFKNLFEEVRDFYLQTRQQIVDNRQIKAEKNRRKYQLELNQDIKNVNILYEIAQDYNSIDNFLSDLALDSTQKTEEPKNGVVTLSTVHSAKGLEWENVYIMDCVDEKFPNKFALRYADEYEEELRCFYVAGTRAKTNLYMIQPQYIMENGLLHTVELSSFIQGTNRYLTLLDYSQNEITHFSKIQFELVPEPLFGINIRSSQYKKFWDEISTKVRSRCQCATCYQKFEMADLDAHEVWEYDDYNNIQKLSDIIPVCKKCHATIHIGRADKETFEIAKTNYCELNNCSETEFNERLERAINTWEERSNEEWEQIIPKPVIYQYIDNKNSSSQRHYINCPYHEKDEAKALGARWDPKKKKWYYTGDDHEKFSKWAS